MIKEIKNNEVTFYSTIPDYYNKNVVGITSKVLKAEELKNLVESINTDWDKVYFPDNNLPLNQRLLLTEKYTKPTIVVTYCPLVLAQIESAFILTAKADGVFVRLKYGEDFSAFNTFDNDCMLREKFYGNFYLDLSIFLDENVVKSTRSFKELDELYEQIKVIDSAEEWHKERGIILKKIMRFGNSLDKSYTLMAFYENRKKFESND